MEAVLTQRRAACAWIVALTCASLALYGYQVGMHNHAIQLPLVRHLQDPSLYPGDPFVETLDGYTTFVWRALAWFATPTSLGVILFIGHVAVQLALYAAVFALTAHLAPRQALAPYLATWFFLWCATDVGGEALHWFYFSHTQLGFALALWALVLGLRGRALMAWIVTGLLFDVHAMQALYTAALLGALELRALGRSREPWARRLRAATVGPLAALALAAPGILWLGRSGASSAPADLPELLWAFFPRHFFASALERRDWAPLAWQCALLVLAALHPGVRRDGRVALGLVAAILALGIVAGGLSELWPTPFLLKLHVFRISSFLAVFSLALGAAWLLEVTRARRAQLGAALGASVLFVAAPLGLSFYPHPIARDWLHVPWAVVAAAAWLPALMPTRGRLARATTMLGLLVMVALAQDVIRIRVQRAAAYQRAHEGWVTVQTWAREHSTPEQRFLTPSYMEGFRVFSERSIVGEWKDGAAVMWDAGYADVWRAWYLAVGGTFEARYSAMIDARLEQSWAALTPAALEAFAREHDAAFIVCARRTHAVRGRDGGALWRGRVLYEDPAYFVVATPR